MKNLGLTTAIAATLTAGFLGLAAPALAAPTGAGNAQDTISSLQAQGYKVIVNRLSEAPLAEAHVVSVGQGPTFTHSNNNAKNTQNYTGYDRQFAPVITKTVYVDVR
ncbi:MAG: hypothetical protein WBB07_27770 [Mycobacterium sp.]